MNVRDFLEPARPKLTPMQVALALGQFVLVECARCYVESVIPSCWTRWKCSCGYSVDIPRDATPPAVGS